MHHQRGHGFGSVAAAQSEHRRGHGGLYDRVNSALLDGTRRDPDDDATAVTAAQLRAVITDLHRAGDHQPGGLDVLIVTDAGYDVVRLAWLLADLRMTIGGRFRSDRVFYTPAEAWTDPTKGRSPRHGAKLALRDATTQPEPTTATVTDHYRRAEATAFARMHPKPVWLWAPSHCPTANRRSIIGGRCSSAASIWSTPSDSSSNRWAEPNHGYAPQKQQTAGPG